MFSPQEVSSDLDAAIGRLGAAGADIEEQRRALQVTSLCLRVLRGYRNATVAGYPAKADQAAGGQAVEAIFGLRGKPVYDLVVDVGSRSQLHYPREDLLRGDEVVPGSYLIWRQPADVVPPLLPAHFVPPKAFGFYMSRLAGRMVLPTLQNARDFLVSSVTLGSL